MTYLTILSQLLFDKILDKTEFSGKSEINVALKKTFFLTPFLIEGEEEETNKVVLKYSYAISMKMVAVKGALRHSYICLFGFIHIIIS